MGSNGCEDVMVSGSNEVKFSEATVEIKIKTLDSQTYTMRVDKCVPVPALKDQIATVTGILSEQQRLICRGKVLKDDQLLSAYHVEDGHTLHLVVRQPIPPSSESFLDHPATDPVLGTGRGQGDQGGPSVVVGTFNIPGQGDGVLPDFSQIISAVLGSFGVTNVGSGSEGGDLQEPVSERLSRTLGLGSLSNSSRQQPDQAASNGQSNPYNGALPLPTAVSLESLQPLVIPDSLTTLSQYLSRLRQEFSDNVRGQSNNSLVADTRGSDEQDSDAASRSAARRGGLPTPASLAEVMLSTRQILNEQVGEFLLQLTRQLEDHANLTNLVARMRIQSDALRSGVLLQNLGAFLLELGRTTMTLRMGQTPADAVVNAGPAVFISTSGPTPIMVQPLPFQPGTSFGAVPVGTVQPAPGSSDGTVRSGFLPRSIDIRIHTAVVNQREPIGGQPLGRTDLATSAGGNSIHQAAAGATGNSSSTAAPARTVVASVPAPVGRTASDSSRGSVGLFYPLLARVEPVTSGNLNSRRGQASDEGQPRGVDSWRQPILDSAVHQQNVDIPQVEGATPLGSWMQHGQSISSQMIHSELDQLLRTIPLGDVNFQGLDTNSAYSEEAAPIVDDEGTFLSNLLRQIMPVVSQNTTGLNNSAGEVAEAIEDRNTQVSTQPQLDRNRGTSSRRRGGSPSPSSSKRQKRE